MFEQYHQRIIDNIDKSLNQLEIQNIIEDEIYLIFYENDTYKLWDLTLCLNYLNWVNLNYKDIFYDKLAEREIVYGNNSINLHIKRITKRIFYLVSVKLCNDKIKNS